MQPIGERLVHQNVFAAFHCCDGDGRVKMIRRHNFDRAHVFLLLQQLAKIGVGRAASVFFRGALIRVNGLDEFFGHVPSSGNAWFAPSPIRFAERGANGCTQSIPGKIHVVVAVLDGIADGNNLYLRHREHPQHLPCSLRAAANVRHRNLLAGRNVSRPTQHVSRHDCKCGGGRPGLDELAPGKARGLALVLLLACLPWF
jgi:hypothetical protein